jgi:hypothetical protein
VDPDLWVAAATIDLGRLRPQKKKEIVQTRNKSQQDGRFPPAELLASISIVFIGFSRTEGDLGTSEFQIQGGDGRVQK